MRTAQERAAAAGAKDVKTVAVAGLAGRGAARRRPPGERRPARRRQPGAERHQGPAARLGAGRRHPPLGVRRARRAHHGLRPTRRPWTEPGEGPVADAREALERLLLDGPRRYTRLQVAELAGMPPERTPAAVAGARLPRRRRRRPRVHRRRRRGARACSSTLIDSGFVGPETEASIARAMGQALSRLADWQTDMLADALTAVGGRGRRPRRHRGRGGGGRPRAAARGCARCRTTSGAGTWRPTPTGCSPPAGPGRPAGTGRRVRRPGRLHLAQPRHGRPRARRDGRGLREHRRRGHRPAPRPGGEDRRRRRALHRGTGRRRRRDRARAARGVGRPRTGRRCASGAAYGAVLTRLGDVYSPVVNLASRLTSLARPATVLVDRELAEQLRGSARSTRCGRCAGCRCAATTTCSRGWCAARSAAATRATGLRGRRLRHRGRRPRHPTTRRA